MSLRLHGDQPVKRQPSRVRPKGADMDRPEEFVKVNLRRTLRRDLKRNLDTAVREGMHPTGCRCTDCASISRDAVGRDR